MFTTRLVSGIILVILALVLVTTGGGVLFAAVAAISLIGMFELYRVMKLEKTPLAAVGYLAAALYYGFVWFEKEDLMMLMAAAFVMVLMAVYVFTFPKYKTEEITITFFGVFYVAVMLSYLFLVRRAAGWRIPGLAGIFKLLGLRYLRVLCRHAVWDAISLLQS